MIQIMEGELVRVAHGSHVEGDDLIVISIRIDETGGCEFIFDGEHLSRVHVRLFKPGAIITKIFTDRCP